jgi:hypothetical protein
MLMATGREPDLAAVILVLLGCRGARSLVGVPLIAAILPAAPEVIHRLEIYFSAVGRFTTRQKAR